MATAVETVKGFMNTLKKYSQDSTQIGQQALDDAIRTVTKFSSLDEAKKNLVDRLKDTETYPDTDTRLKEATGMVLAPAVSNALNDPANQDLTEMSVNIEVDPNADTGAISGSNAGGSTVKNANDIVPEDDVDLSTLPLPEPGSTTPITYTGEDGKTFTFYVKWPDSFTTLVHGYNLSSIEEMDSGLMDSRNYVDLAQFNPDDSYTYVKTNDDGSTETATYPTYGTIIQRMSTVLKGLNNYWLKEGAKLDYDSLGLALDGQTIEIIFMGGSFYDLPAANTFAIRQDTLPANQLAISINVTASKNYWDPSDPNGAMIEQSDLKSGEKSLHISVPASYLDRLIAHELVHAVMSTTGTLKKGMPQFFTEGIAEVVQGEDDFVGNKVYLIQELVDSPSLLQEALGLGQGTGTSYAYPAGDMFMRFIAKQSLDVTSFVGDSDTAQTFSYDTKSAVITDYDEDDTINFDKDVEGYSISETFNDFQIESSDGLLAVRDVRGKIMTFNNSKIGTAYAYMASDSSEVNGSNIGGGNNYEVLFGANYENNTIRAGYTGSYLWGGIRGNDVLFGGNGVDTFAYSFNGGNDIVQNAESKDSVLFNDITIDQLSAAQINDDGVYLKFTDGGTLTVNGKVSTFVVKNDEGSATYRADYESKSWWTQA